MAAEARHVLWRQRLDALLTEVRDAFTAGAKGHELVVQMCKGVDALLIDLWQATAGEPHADIDIVAVGGYGRGELCPFSDWDLWFLLPESSDAAAEQHIQRFLYVLWDLRVRVGHAVRTVDDTLAHVRESWDSATAAMESRLLWGKGEHYGALRAKLARAGRRQRRRFVRAKLEEFAKRRQRMGESAFLMEPDVKEGSGGLRDIQALMWMTKAWYGTDRLAELTAAGALTASECRQLLAARDLLWRLRCGLHLLAGRANDRLDFESQAQLADMFGYRDLPHQPAVERLMKHYFRHAGRVARIADMLVLHFREQLAPRRFVPRKRLADGFVLQGRSLDIAHDAVLREQPLRLLGIFRAAQEGRRRLSSHALRLIGEHARLINRGYRKDARANAIFLDILRQPRNVAWALKEMHDTGVLGRFVPEFGRVVGLGQFNRYHAYPVDAHTIRAIAEARRLRLGRIENQRLLWVGEIMSTLSRPELLYLALLFHDLGKGRPEDHSELGAHLAHRFCRRLGLDRDASELVTWLVRHHLLMAITSQRCDLSDDHVIARFADQVGDLERLRYLLVLTVADIHAVGPNVWNDWKGSLLHELYTLTEQRLLIGPVRGADLSRRITARIQAAVAGAAAGEREALAACLHSLPPRVLVRLPPGQLRAIGGLLLGCGRETGVKVHLDAIRGETLVFVITADRPGLFAELAAAIGSGHVSILAAQAFALGDGRVLDVFHVQDDRGRPLSEASDQQQLCRRIDKALAGEYMPMPARPGVHVLMQRVPVRVRALPSASTRQTAIEVVAADRPGLLATLARTIADAGVNVRGAAISTFGEKAVDVFFLSDGEGRPLTAAGIEAVCDRLRQAAQLPEVGGKT